MVNTIEIRPASTRFHTQIGWLDSYHSFSFGDHYDAANTHHGLLLVSNDDRVQPGMGFGTHGHTDMEIVTWVLSGRLLHEDSAGNRGEIVPGLAQRMSAGSGIRHSEMNASQTDPVHFVQMWVPPHVKGIEPGYEQLDINAELATGGLHPVASGQGHDGTVTIHQREAVLWAGRLSPREHVDVPTAPHVHVFVPIGAAVLGEAGAGTTHPLETGDAARITGVQPLSLDAGPGGAEVLIWATA